MEIEIYSLKNNNCEYRSISNIQKISNYDLIHMDYDYILNLQTFKKLSNTVDIYINKTELAEMLIIPLRNILENRNSICKSKIYNYIASNNVGYYKFIKLIRNKLLYNIILSRGTKIEMSFKFYKESNKFIILKTNVYIKGLLFKYKLKELQPVEITFTIFEARELLTILNNL